jgi:ATP-dependent exoDNAse (exonuclease V) beta subunit
MTVHGAKGLEFDVVFLPFLDWRPLASAGHRPPYLLERSSEPPGLPMISMAPDQRWGDPGPGHRLLKRLADGRKMGEAKRILYVGMTRARKTLFLSGLGKGIEDGFTAAKNTPLDWILKHVMRHGDDLIAASENPSCRETATQHDRQIKDLPEPLPFHPQPIPYVVETPSELGDLSSYPQEAMRSQGKPLHHAAIRGTVTHRLIETLWKAGEIPETERICSALASEGMNRETAGVLAREISEEMAACRKEGFFRWLLDSSHPGGKSEYSLEALKKPGIIQAGILDFVRREGDAWWIVDFKTSRPEPGQDVAEFIAQQQAYYGPQLNVYRAMLAKARGIDASLVRIGLYFTGLQQWHEIE